jgi:hypothetical protein
MMVAKANNIITTGTNFTSDIILLKGTRYLQQLSADKGTGRLAPQVNQPRRKKKTNRKQSRGEETIDALSNR